MLTSTRRLGSRQASRSLPRANFAWQACTCTLSPPAAVRIRLGAMPSFSSAVLTVATRFSDKRWL